jgi:hypothetical protein
MIGKRSTRIEALKRLEETPEKHNEQVSITQPSKKQKCRAESQNEIQKGNKNTINIQNMRIGIVNFESH